MTSDTWTASARRSARSHLRVALSFSGHRRLSVLKADSAVGAPGVPHQRTVARNRSTSAAHVSGISRNGTWPTSKYTWTTSCSRSDFLPVLGVVNAIRIPVSKPVTSSPSDTAESPIFTYAIQGGGVDAQSPDIDGEFTMLAGSLVVPSWHGVGKAPSTKKAYASYRSQHEQLLADGAIFVEDGQGRVTRNIVFPSPSTAGAVALGRSCNGRREWISPTEGRSVIGKAAELTKHERLSAATHGGAQKHKSKMRKAEN